MKKVPALLTALVLLGSMPAAAAEPAKKPVAAAAAAKPAKVLPPSPAYLCATKAIANKLEGIELKLFMSGCLQAKNPAKFK